MVKQTRTARVYIDHKALQHNLQRVKSIAPNCRVMAVIKANAYGHGMLMAAEALSDADAFALASANEALALRQSGETRPLVVLQGFSDEQELRALAEHEIDAVVHHVSQIDLLSQYAGVKLNIWLKVDTGMHRLGIPMDMAEASYQRLRKCASVGKIRLMSHFANADEPEHDLNSEQLTAFASLIDTLGIEEASLANSAGLIALPESRLQWLRPGIMLYGSSPLLHRSADELGLQAVMQFESRLIAIQNLKKGDDIGYGSSWRCPEDMPVGVVAAGYGDGYPRHAQAGTPVWLNDAQCPLLGRVSMDSVCIDLRGVTADVGDRAVLWGKELSVDVIAKHASTISYELLCHAGACSIATAL